MKTSYIARVRGGRRRGRDRVSSQTIHTGRMSGLQEAVTDFLEVDASCRAETIESPNDPSNTLLAVFEGGTIRVAEELERDGRLLVPKVRNGEVLEHVRLPKGAVPYESVRSLFTRVGAVLAACLDLDPPNILLVSFYVMCSWFPERLPVAPYLALVGTPRSGKTTLLRVLGLLCRHSLLVADISSAAVYQVYQEMCSSIAT